MKIKVKIQINKEIAANNKMMLSNRIFMN